MHGTILVVEDDARSSRLLSASLKGVGHRIVVASSGEEAQRLAASEGIDLVLSDLCLPGIDGVELTRRLRASAATRGVPVLLVTSIDDRQVLARGLEAGADDLLTKPVNAVELRARVQSLLRNKAVVDELHGRHETALPFAGVTESAERIAPREDARPDAAAEQPCSAVLLIEDNEAEARLMQAYFEELGCRAHRVVDAQNALHALAERPWDLVVVDLILPDRSGYAIVQHVKNDASLVRTPVLVVSALADVQDRVRALEMGADDFVVKGSDRLEFNARVRRLLRLKHSLDRLADHCDRVQRLAITDSLTGLFTHGFLQDALQRQVESARRCGDSLSLVFIDIDHFKSINDRYGHAVGDQALRLLADVVRSSIRRDDIAVRYGGEEFAILMPHTSPAEAERVAERLRCASEGLEIACTKAAGNLRLTISAGISGLPDDATDAAGLLEHADEAMYLAKHAGRNRVVVFGAVRQPCRLGARILIVDDEARNLRLLEACLAPEGYAVLPARDGAEAVEIARREQPDLILLDGMMPRLSGFDACRRLKQESSTHLIPVILVTALNGRDDKLRAIEVGADDFLSKPLDKVELLARMRALLRAKRSTDLLENAETVIFTLARAVESRDPSTGGHVERVSHYAEALGAALGLPDRELEGLRRAGIVHDIGKIAIPDSILLKAGPLTAEEFRIMQSHAEIGYNLLRPLRTFSESLPAVRFHHERMDGSGYPLGLRAEQIPLVAQIMAVADVFDALTNDRSYRRALGRREALEILREEASRGIHDARLIDAMEGVVALGEVSVQTEALA